MKKAVWLLPALFLLLSPLSAYADSGVTLTLASVEGRVGDTVEIPLTLADNPGIVSAQIKLKFDETRLQLLSVKDGGILGREIKHQETLTSPYTLSWENYVAKENFTENGVLCTLSFRVLAGEPGQTVPVTMSVEDYGVMNLALQDLPRKLTDGGVTVIEGASASPASWIVTGVVALIPVAAVAAVLIIDYGKKNKKEKKGIAD
ncbi:MAG: hypothetical protein J6Z79_03170 [Clostridia bacterium]|nr:hypothetical protein [Clostridia bacterium]